MFFFDVQYLVLKQKLLALIHFFREGRGYGIPFAQINIKKIFIFYKEKCTFDVSNFQIFLRSPTMVATEELRFAQLWDFPPAMSIKKYQLRKSPPAMKPKKRPSYGTKSLRYGLAPSPTYWHEFHMLFGLKKEIALLHMMS